jgi:gliding motility-associated-like protein
VTITLDFTDVLFGEETYTGCSSDGYEVVVNGTLYNEANTNGVEVLTSNGGCDSIVTVALLYAPASSFDLTYSGCQGDGFETVINGNIYGESNPSGTEILTNQNGCDSIVHIMLAYAAPSTHSISHSGCSGDGFEVLVNGTIYNENNPTGTEILIAGNGCDSVIMVNLSFGSHAIVTESYSGCTGDGYFISINGNIYNETNPVGTEILPGSNGCDTIVSIAMQFNASVTSHLEYSGCAGDGYTVTVNGTVYNETNPFGMETLASSLGCDSLVTINLIYLPQLTGEVEYEGCAGDGYSIVVNGTVYHQANPQGVEVLSASNGCDSIVSVNLVYHPVTSSLIAHEGCAGDGYSVMVNSTVYHEQNPSGTEVLISQAGCDSVVAIDLHFHETVSSNYNYAGCEGDGFSISINGSEYNQLNPLGVEVLQSAAGCDSTIAVQLEFEPCDTIECSYYVPNIFSANGDNINDAFRFYFSEQCRILTFEIQIFDRWGALLFESTDLAFTWDARFRNQELNPGVYVYVAEIFIEGEADPILDYGDITLIR